MSNVCPRCGREPMDIASPAARAAGLVCDQSCSAQRLDRGPWRDAAAKTQAASR
jgi:hypothetical protein